MFVGGVFIGLLISVTLLYISIVSELLERCKTWGAFKRWGSVLAVTCLFFAGAAKAGSILAIPIGLQGLLH